ncbi:MAG TPA: DNA/RNA helicase domain-containing protein [Verrucomicrobiae bacterium]|nr:DNA/RNA helicase domain-containing protein [Verrucomicrobiae bacterium]
MLLLKSTLSPVRQEYTRNKYRVLLTRAREGMVIWIPEGDPGDPTRSVTAMNETAG